MILAYECRALRKNDRSTWTPCKGTMQLHREAFGVAWYVCSTCGREAEENV